MSYSFHILHKYTHTINSHFHERIFEETSQGTLTYLSNIHVIHIRLQLEIEVCNQIDAKKKYQR